MFTLLTPLALWLAPLIALPLILHLTGRARPVERDFPSLLPVRASLTRAMRRRRVRDWLQLILRTLALLCLLLAAADPLLRRGDALRPPAVAAVLRHNGAWDARPARARSDATAGPAGWQQRLRDGLDSLTSGRLAEETVLPDAAPGAARFGRPGEALARLLRRPEVADAGDAAIHVYAPVFAARDLAEYAGAARAWLESHPRARLILVAPARDASPAPTALAAFAAPRGDADADGNLFTMRAAAIGAPSTFPPVWRDGTTDSGAARIRTARRDRDTVRVTLPLPEHGWIAGTLAPADDDPRRDDVAFPALAAAWHVPPPASLCLAGGEGARAWTVQTARATLGAPGPRTRIRLLGSEGSARADDASDETPCRLLYLADPETPDDALTARAVAVVRRGGLLVLEAGPRLDPVRWNRRLLAPLGVGRLTGALREETIAARPRRADLDRLGLRAAGWGEPGRVRTRHGFHPDAAASVLLTAGDGEPLLVHRRVGRESGGAVLLWLTALSDPAWSDLATRPWAALLHRAFVERAGAAGIVEHAVDADSLAFLPAEDGTDDVPPRVVAPDGTPFNETGAGKRLRPAPGGWLAGPFDAPGLYRIETTGDGSPGWLAVRPAPTPRAPNDADWSAFRELLGDSASARTQRLENPEEWRGLYGGLRLRLGLLVMAALLLFADGLVTLRLSPSRT